MLLYFNKYSIYNDFTQYLSGYPKAKFAKSGRIIVGILVLLL